MIFECFTFFSPSIPTTYFNMNVYVFTCKWMGKEPKQFHGIKTRKSEKR
jgi:hypothetical protein